MTAGTKENPIAYAWTIFNIYYLPAEVEKKYMHYPGICCSPLIISALSPKKCSGYTGICHSCLLCWLVPLKQKLSHCTHAQQDKKCGPHMTDIDFPVDKYYAQQADNVPQPLHRDGGWVLQAQNSTIASVRAQHQIWKWLWQFDVFSRTRPEWWTGNTL